ncbi:MAG: restriction endonuclease subunit S [Candidatus Thalassarchaeaceae archaeon]
MISEQWKSMHFMDCIEKVKVTSKIQKKKYLSEGKYPIISQDNSTISGYWDNSEDLFVVEKSVVVFGDHTCVLKFIDFDFVVGADGVKILKTKDFLNAKFFFYQLLSFNLQSTGYARHFRKLKEHMISIPPLEEQQRIVSILDEAFENISVKLSNAEENMLQAENLFSNELETVFSQRHENWNEMKLDEIGNIQTGTTPKTSERENYGDYISFIKPAAFAKDGAIIHTDDRLSEIGYGKSRPVKPFSVLMVCIGATIGKCGYNVVEVTTNQQINSLTPKNAKLYKFLYYQMLTRKFQHSVVTNAGQSTLPCLSKSKWSKLSLLVPTDGDEIQSIISRFDNLRNECEILRGKYAESKTSLVELKQSILQEAFNGTL